MMREGTRKRYGNAARHRPLVYPRLLSEGIIAPLGGYQKHEKQWAGGVVPCSNLKVALGLPIPWRPNMVVFPSRERLADEEQVGWLRLSSGL
jgi:hypothetical protein